VPAGASILGLTPDACGVGRGPEIHVVSNTKTIPEHPILLANSISSPRTFADTWAQN
jgi:hypothetical protein